MPRYESSSVPVPTLTPEEARQRQQRAIDRAVHKAHEQAEAGNLPRLLRTFTSPDGLETRQYWTIGSRTTGGRIYNVDLVADGDGLKTMCDCEAASVCWHRASVRLAALGELECHRAQWPTVTITRADLFGRVAEPERDPWPAAALDEAAAYAAVS